MIARVSYAQPPYGPADSSPGQSSYPWPAPIDARHRSFERDRDQSSTGNPAFGRPSGQQQQRWLAQQEASRGRNRKSLWGTSSEGTKPSPGESSSSRWSIPWPSSLGPSWLTKTIRSRDNLENSTDPFLRERSGQDDTATVPAEDLETGNLYAQRGDPFTSRLTSGGGYESPSNRQIDRPINTATRVPVASPPGDVAQASYPSTSPPSEPSSGGPQRDNAPQAASEPDLFEPGRLVAMVGDQPILAGDLLGQIGEMLLPYVGKASETQLQERREVLMRQLLPQLINVKLLSLDVLRTIPVNRRGEIEQKLSEEFAKSQLKQMVEKAKVASPRELDAKLRTFGSSLDHQRRLFIDQTLAMQARYHKVQLDTEVTPGEMLDYYRAHASEYEYPAQARWERLMVRFENFPSKDAARHALAEMGNQVYYGASLAAVAQRLSQGTSAHQGGYHDWTTHGSLVSEVIDRAIFALPVGELSPILEDEKGFHIVRVIDRRAAGRISFPETQGGIKEKILKERRQTKQREYLERLHRETRISTVFDDETAAAPYTAEGRTGDRQPYR